ncbi:hypothetical protein F4780DRAFT_772383 [Xylariomycetidae sp. FL0641]|nr:hypothetical protein F4780DRAFT_772383 [Xylariomycetidae sp. FL0641]
MASSIPATTAAAATANNSSASEIFATQTLAQVRATHKALAAAAEARSARLRVQVGGSYRELLGTADAIVGMRGDMGAAQAVLARMGGRCGRAVVAAKAGALAARYAEAEAEADTQRGQAREVVRARLLGACNLAVARLLRRSRSRSRRRRGGADSANWKREAAAEEQDEDGGGGERLVCAAKVLVLARLLVASFGELKAAVDADAETRDAVEAAKKSLGSLRRRLLRAVEKVLEKVGEETRQSEILKALSAYSLASSSGAKDVLRHFLNVRAEAIAYEFDFEEHDKERNTERVIKGLELYTRTLLDVQSIVPGKLSAALSDLKRNPLLADESLKSIEGLRLDIYERWCGDDIQYFTPFIRHDDLDGKQAREMLSSWAKKGEETLLKGLQKTLEHITEFKTIVELRTSVLQRWIQDGGKAKGFDPSDMLDGLRKVINDHLLHMLESKVNRLHLVGSEMAATLEAWQTGVTDQHHGLWDADMLDMDISKGAGQFTHEIISRLHGRNDAVARAVTGFESWHHIIDNVGDLVEQLKRQRWNNDIDEIEDEDVIEARQQMLSKDDPQLLHERLDATLDKAFHDLDEQITTLWNERKDGQDSGRIAMYILRILRDIRSRLPKLESVKAFGLDNVPSLHDKLAKQVLTSPLEEFCTTALTRKRVAGRALWEGEPPLPSQPSPGTFNLLRDLVTSMGDAGLDLWTPAAVKALKEVLGSQLGEVWRKELNASTADTTATEKVGESEETTEEGGDGGGDQSPDATPDAKADATKDGEVAQNADERSPDVYVQWLYDVHLLQHCLAVEGRASNDLQELGRELLEKTEHGGDSKGRLVKASEEYWKRTNLLFGLLAVV